PSTSEFRLILRRHTRHCSACWFLIPRLGLTASAYVVLIGSVFLAQVAPSLPGDVASPKSESHDGCSLSLGRGSATAGASTGPHKPRCRFFLPGCADCPQTQLCRRWLWRIRCHPR